MARYTFEAYYPDGSPRRHVGSFRPPKDEARKAATGNPSGYLPAYHVAQFEEKYASGWYDRQLYELDPEEYETTTEGGNQ